MPQEINETEKFWLPEHSQKEAKMREFEKKSLHDRPAPVPPPTKHIIDDEGEKLRWYKSLYFLKWYLGSTIEVSFIGS